MIVACLLASGALPAPVAPSTLCPGRPFFLDAGRSDVLGMFVGLGVRCTVTQNWTVSTGLRYTDQRQNTLPFLILAYSKPIAPGLTASITGSLRERWGDYEIDRLPEVGLRLTLLQRPASSASLQVFAGSITTLSTEVHTSRVGAILEASHLIRLSPSVDLTPALRLGNIGYGTGQQHEFWVGTAQFVIRPTSKTDLGLLYLKQDSRGTTPLLFDVVNFDHTLTGWIGLAIIPTARVGLSATANLFTVPSWTMKEYTLSWTQHGKWTASVTWRVTDNRMWLGLALAP